MTAARMVAGQRKLARWASGLVAACALLVCQAAQANIQNRLNYSSVVLDARGNVISAANPDEPRFPASLTKMMTLYMLFEAMRDGRVRPETRIAMSAEASSRPPSKLGVPAGYSLELEDAILAVVTRSANDVATAIGEHLGGSEDRFAQMMTQRARSLGMTRTTFRNASGLPDPEQTTTARDMATLGRRLMEDFPTQYRYFATTQFRWNNRPIHNHNHMLSSYDGVDGIKTGYTRLSGFNIVTSARRDGVRLVGAVMGGGSWIERDRHMAELLDDAFARSGVARRPNSYDALATNRGNMRPAEPAVAARPAAHTLARTGRAPQPVAQGSAPPTRAQARAILARQPGRPAVAARAPQHPAREASASRAPQPARARAVVAPQPVRPRAVEMRQPVQPHPARPIRRTAVDAVGNEG